ncbi:MAG: helix-turn-helix transcriptional regulator [Abitibacteriaceae bacterium]|nr:helix-turn-helix transcriptional regulator [Abditibacteriaceae bacterium]
MKPKRAYTMTSKGSGPIFEYRIQHNLSQEAMADLLDCSVSCIQQCENQGRLPGKQTTRNRFQHLLQQSPLEI